MGKDNDMKEGSSRDQEFLGAPYNDVIHWLNPYDGSRERYKDFVDNCERCFNSIESRGYSSLMNLIIHLYYFLFTNLCNRYFGLLGIGVARSLCPRYQIVDHPFCSL